MSTSLKADVEEFKTQVPILQVICNPGLRDRHWEQMTEVVGIDNFAPEPGSSVSRYLAWFSKHIRGHCGLQVLWCISDN